MKKTNVLLIGISFLIASCDYKSKPYLKHEMKFEKIAGDCVKQDPQISVEANTIGERYVFQECLDASFNGDREVERNGDTVVVKMGKPSDAKSLFKITLDINTRPTYHFLTINGNTIAVTVTRD